MQEKHLFEDERFLLHSNDGVITLTDHRLRYSKKGKETSHLFSVLLENVASIELKFSSKPLFWKLALLFLLIGGGAVTFGVMEREQGAFVISLGAGLVAIIMFTLFFATMKHLLHIHTKSGNGFSFSGKEMKRDKIVGFMNKVEKAMKERNEKVGRGE